MQIYELIWLRYNRRIGGRRRLRRNPHINMHIFLLRYNRRYQYKVNKKNFINMYDNIENIIGKLIINFSPII